MDVASTPPERRRILLVDDNPEIHADFRKILSPRVENAAFRALESEVLGTPRIATRLAATYEIDSAFQGQEACALVRAGQQANEAYLVAFVDIRMPPGWDGIQTSEEIWRLDPHVQVVICTAYSDYTWEETFQRLGCPDRYVILKKPFDAIEVRQLALALSEKALLGKRVRLQVDELEQHIAARTQALQESHQRLEREVAERQVLEEGLRRSQRLEALGQLVAGVAHEINNPLSFISCNLHYLQEELAPNLPEGDERASLIDAVDEALEGSDRIQRIVTDLRSFSREKSNGTELVDIQDISDSAINVARGKIEAVSSIIKSYQSVPKTLLDPGKLGQVLLNLLVNATQAFSVRTAENQIQLHVKPGEQDQILIEVSDNGCGIPPENLKRIFDPFFTTKPVGVGTGLGLSICHRIVEGFGGELTVKSELGRGTTFSVRVPIRSHLEEPEVVEAMAAV